MYNSLELIENKPDHVCVLNKVATKKVTCEVMSNQNGKVVSIKT